MVPLDLRMGVPQHLMWVDVLLHQDDEEQMVGVEALGVALLALEAVVAEGVEKMP